MIFVSSLTSRVSWLTTKKVFEPGLAIESFDRPREAEIDKRSLPERQVIESINPITRIRVIKSITAVLSETTRVFKSMTAVLPETTRVIKSMTAVLPETTRVVQSMTAVLSKTTRVI